MGRLRAGVNDMPKQMFIVPTKLTEYIMLGNGKKLYLTEHSKQRIKTRKISDEDIKKTFEHPDITIPNSDYSNAKNYIKRINDRDDKLQLGVKDEGEPFVLITAFVKNSSI